MAPYSMAGLLCCARRARLRNVERKLPRHERGQPLHPIEEEELVGDFKNGGREWRPHGRPIPVRVHDFLDRDLGKAIPYGVYDLANNEGSVSVGIDHDTAEFAVNAIRLWWTPMGRHRFPRARTLLITADG